MKNGIRVAIGTVIVGAWVAIPVTGLYLVEQAVNTKVLKMYLNATKPVVDGLLAKI